MKIDRLILSPFWVLCLMLSTSLLPAQNFEPNQLIDSLPVSKNPTIKIVDVDEDGRLDVFMRGRDLDGILQSLIAHRVPDMDTIANDSFQLITVNIDSTHRGVYEFSDLNNDNFMDLVVSGLDSMGKAKTAIYHGLAGFDFEAPLTISSFNASMLSIADLNNDGQKEIIMSGLDSLGDRKFRIVTKEEDSYVDLDSLILPGLINGDMVVFDFDNDGADDIFYYGRDSADVFQSRCFVNGGEMNFVEWETQIPGILNGSVAVGDFDYDGKGDLLLNGMDKNGDTLTAVYLNRDTIFEDALLNLTGISANDLLFADLNGDGAVELVFNGLDSSGLFVNHAYLNDGSNNLTKVDTLLPGGGSLSQAFGDFFRDGNLDAVQLKKEGEKWQLEFFRNIDLPVNFSPAPPAELFTINTYEDVKIIWTDPFDATTPSSSISGDLFISQVPGDVDLVSPDFDYDEEKRLLVSQGNQGYRRITSRSDLPVSIYYFGLQAVDNSFHAGPNDDSSPGGGGGGPSLGIDSFVVCNDLVDSTIVACEGSIITLPAPDGAQTGWYSKKKEYLGISSNLTYVVGDADSVFYAVVNSLECAEHGVYIIEPFAANTVDILSDTLLCSGDSIQLSYTGVFDSIEWVIDSSMDTITDSFVDLIAAEDETINLIVSDGLCVYADEMVIEVSQIELEVEEKVFEIVLGESVQLEATGADTYKWSPPEGLDDVNSPTPIATPSETTTYTVLGTNMDECTDLDEVLIIVNTLSFAPTLFTPNNDGRNDQFKIYGPTYDGTLDFNFKIFNRAGVKVYEADNYADAQNIGWDGYLRGKPQPAGIYYWKVSGTQENGEPFLINEAESGVLHLMR